ncbi:MAG TPA: UGSC family (seleno)protein, partial [Vineibacter sp.]|nr:UGSC family (seleno)protein [Vineibacter sp.]
MKDTAEIELLDIPDLDAEAWNEFALEQGWGDGMPLALPTEAAVAKFVAVCRGDNQPFAAVSPRQVVPTLQSLAANAVMAGCKPAYFPVVLAALRGVLNPDYNLHGTLATTHPCAPMVLVSGPMRKSLDINCGSNCFGQGWRANATIGRALQLILLNVGGAKPGEMDRATHGSPAKFAYCFGENEEESPWTPFHVRRGFATG